MKFIYKFLFLAAILPSCNSSSESSDEIYVDHELENRLEQLTEIGRYDTVRIMFRLDTLTDYSWDTLIIVTPYYPIEEIEQQTKVDLAAIKNTGIENDEASNVLAFVKNGQLISYVDLPRPKGDFASNSDSLIIVTPENSTFVLERTEKYFVSGQAVVKIKKNKKRQVTQ